LIFIASTLAQSTLPANAGIIIVLVMIIAVLGFGALLWSAIADSRSKDTPSSSVRVLRAPTAASQPKTETIAAKAPVVDAPAAVTAPQAVAPIKPPAPVVSEPVVSEPEVSKPAVVAVPEPEPLPEEPALVQPSPWEPDDLQRLEGIGPKIAGVLANDGVTTYAQVAAMTPDQIRTILIGKVRLFNPDTWPEQAQLAAAGRWDELIEFQRTLKAGRRA
jgi:small subunit ribosomal protein S2